MPQSIRPMIGLIGAFEAIIISIEPRASALING
jgi:hypothetical protein